LKIVGAAFRDYILSLEGENGIKIALQNTAFTKNTADALLQNDSETVYDSV
jgi:hypothetical protein